DQEEAIIQRYVDRYGWKMNKTETGLRWMIYHHGNGATVELGKIAVIEYKTYSLDGRLLYSSEKDRKKSFLIGHGGVESGLEEAILFLKIGDKSRFVLPSHLAFGLTGDGNKIKGRNSLMMEVELIDLK
ncbi:MAG: FKBP-type peptidyl-prolyl cis-trans isomerase, partial [Bacteroidales bacterium]|nr:FKBP-type peptidyl-prolyl cis-trans isomerase [Bacteroidales bacterium]